MLAGKTACNRVLFSNSLLTLRRHSCFLIRFRCKVDRCVLSLCPRRGFRTTVIRFQKQQPKNPGGGDLLDYVKLAISMILIVVYLVTGRGKPNDGDDDKVTIVTWKDFVNEMLSKGEVEKISVAPGINRVFILLHTDAVFKGRNVGMFNRIYRLDVGSIDSFENNLRKAEQELGIPLNQSVNVVYIRPTMFSTTVGFVSVGLIAWLVFSFLGKRGMGLGKKSTSSPFTGMFDGLRKAKFREVDSSFRVSENLKVKFSDVIGLREPKIEIREFVDYLKTPEKYTKLGAKLPKGALMFGPPGCGKTLLAKAVASEANVPFLATNGPEFVEMVGGVGAARVRDLFKEAKRRAPCMIYIDEIDAIGRKRSTSASNWGGSSEEENTLNQMLAEMDGVDSAQGIVVLASTNRADTLDKALLRRGRFDRHIDIDLPNLSERQELFEYYLKKIKLDNRDKNHAVPLAKMTPGFTGADICNVCNEAALRAASEDKAAVTEHHLYSALDRVLTGSEKRSRTVPPEEKEIVAYHESGHALMGWLLKHTHALLKVTIVPRTEKALGFAQYEPQDKKIYSQEELMDSMCMLLGGRAAEILIFNQPQSGAQNDLERATKMAYDQVKNYGMSKAIGPISFAPSSDGSEYAFTKPYSKKLAALIDLEASALVTSAYKRAEDILRRNKDKLDKLAKALLKSETLMYEDVVALIGPPPFGAKKTTTDVDLTLPHLIDEQEPQPEKTQAKNDENAGT